MPDQRIAGRTRTGRVRSTSSITLERDFAFIRDVVRAEVYIDFGEEHLEHGDTVDLMVGLSDDSVRESGRAILYTEGRSWNTPTAKVENG